MSIPQICPNCENHISKAHAPGCCYGTPEYAHIGWPNQIQSTEELRSYIKDELAKCDSSASASAHTRTLSMEELASWERKYADFAAIQRMIEFLADEEDSEELVGEIQPNFAAICLLQKRCDELRKEAAGIHLVDARAKRTFAIDILNALISELSE